METDDRFTPSDNRDPITDAPGAHPVGTGIGATGGALAGAAAGTLGGPIGMAVGGVAGALVGGLAGKAAAESVNPTDEEAYWRNNYTRESYYEAGRTYNDYGPAYELGWNYRSRYGEDFENYESRLASDWENQRGVSKLSWSQARSASRAAWDRVDNTISGVNPATEYDTGNDDVINTLNELIETSRDGEYGFKACAEHTTTTDLKTLFRKRAEQCRDCAAELRGHVLRLGGEPVTSGSGGGALHRGWVAVRGTLSGYSDRAMLEECERGEEAAVARYRKALKTSMPSDVHTLVQQQLEGAQTSHGQIKTLHDQQPARV
jgi:uncharacterized protein (TIGR02284 family)